MELRPLKKAGHSSSESAEARYKHSLNKMRQNRHSNNTTAAKPIVPHNTMIALSPSWILKKYQ
jgi:hypothetical protein